MTTQSSRTAALFLTLAASLTMAFGQTSNTASSPGATPSSAAAAQPLQAAPDAAPQLTWGGDLRLRNEYFNSALALNAAAPLH